jgi:hypothetical protein
VTGWPALTVDECGWVEIDGTGQMSSGVVTVVLKYVAVILAVTLAVTDAGVTENVPVV